MVSRVTSIGVSINGANAQANSSYSNGLSSTINFSQVIYFLNANDIVTIVNLNQSGPNPNTVVQNSGTPSLSPKPVEMTILQLD